MGGRGRGVLMSWHQGMVMMTIVGRGMCESIGVSQTYNFSGDGDEEIGEHIDTSHRKAVGRCGANKRKCGGGVTLRRGSKRR